MWTIEEEFRSYDLLLDVDVPKGLQVAPDFLLIGLNEHGKWFNEEFFCFEGNPRVYEIMFIPPPMEEPPNRFCINLEQAVKYGIHQIDFLMCMDLENPQPLNYVPNLNVSVQDKNGLEHIAHLNINSSFSDYSCVLFSLRLSGNKWKLDLASRTFEHQIEDLMLAQYGAVKEDDYLNPAPHENPSPAIELFGFSVEEAPASTASGESTQTDVSRNKPDFVGNTSTFTGEEASFADETHIDTGSNYTAPPIDLAAGFSQQTEVTNSDPAASAVEDAHPLKGVEASKVKIAPKWKGIQLRWHCFDKDEKQHLEHTDSPGTLFLSSCEVRGQESFYDLSLSGLTKDVCLGDITVITGMQNLGKIKGSS